MGAKSEIPQEAEGTDDSALFQAGAQRRPTSALYFQFERKERDVRTARYTLALTGRGERPRALLFDNQEDPFQLRNLAESRPELVRQPLPEELEPWLRRTRDPWRPAAT